MTFLLLQVANAALAAASIWIHFRAPALWDDQAIVYSTVAGTLMACMTAIFLGGSMIFSESSRKTHYLNLLLTLAFSGLQGWMLFLLSRNLGLIEMIRSRMGD